MDFIKKQGKIFLIIAASFILGFLLLKSPTEKQKIFGFINLTPSPEEWIAFSSPDALFQAKLPTIPRHILDSKNPSSTRKHATFISEDSGGIQYFIEVSAYSSNDTEKDFFQEELDFIIASNSQNQVMTYETQSWQGLPSKNFLIQNLETGSTFQGIMIKRDNFVYSLFIFYPYDGFKEEKYSKFLDSFKLL